MVGPMEPRLQSHQVDPGSILRVMNLSIQATFQSSCCGISAPGWHLPLELHSRHVNVQGRW